MDILGPDVFVNASVALGSAPEQVIKRVLGKPGGKPKSTDWVIARIEGMLSAIPSFKKEALEPQMKLIRDLVEIVALKDSPGPDAWEKGLVASAKAAGAERVITDHPDLADTREVDGVQFISSEAWLVEQTTPPPPPPMAKKA
ncbi:MAG: hypothetical protein M3Y87_24375 [Myxococcota bacterium]|nr:hypothetical protein [Myxococcota bacterium]